MKLGILKFVAALLALMAGSALAATPVVSNVSVAQRAGTKLVDIYYDVADADGTAQTVWINVSGDGGVTWTIPASSVSGAVGSGIAVGTGKRIVWNAGQDWNGQLVSNCKVRVYANDGTTPIPPAGMAYIPSGLFQMGDNLDSESDAQPVHNVQVDAFFMDINDVSGAFWNSVHGWGAGNGYTDINSGSYYALNHPAQSMSWWDAVKWCNARSEKEGLTPAYYTDATLSQVYRTANLNINNSCVNWSANGYRLATEAEWEKAARGGVLGQRYPWGNTIGGSNANYFGSGDPFEGNSPATTPCGYYNGSQTPTGPDMANGYGLYDMTGNIYTWCWDWYDSMAYSRSDAGLNPKGPNTGVDRLLRGGAWRHDTTVIGCARRFFNGYGPNAIYNFIGVRCVRGH